MLIHSIAGVMTREIEVAMAGETAQCVRIRYCPMAKNESVFFQNEFCLYIHITGIALVSIRRMELQCHSGITNRTNAPNAERKTIRSTVMMVVAIVQGQLVRNTVQFELSARNPVGYPTNSCAEIAPTMQVFIQCVIP